MCHSDVPVQPSVQAKTKKLGTIIFCDELVPMILTSEHPRNLDMYAGWFSGEIDIWVMYHLLSSDGVL
jgi:hypothetical protein